MPNVLSFVVMAMAVAVALRSPASMAATADPIAGLSATDRAIQMAAVESLVAQESDPGDDLIELSLRATRPDVQAMIARVLAGRGNDGLATLLALVEADPFGSFAQSGPLTGWVAAQHGQRGFDALLARVEAVGFLAAPDAAICAWYLGLDARALGLRLSRHESEWVRYLALVYLFDDTPVAVSAEDLLRLSQSENEIDRWTAAGLLPWWTETERAEKPALYEKCADALVAMLSDPAESVRQQAALGVLHLEPVPAAAQSMLRAAILGEGQWPLEQPPAMVAYLAIERDDAAQREAIELVAGRVEHATVDVISALRQVSPNALDGDLLSRVLDAGVRKAQTSRNEGERAREELTALLLETPDAEYAPPGAKVVLQLSSLVGNEDYQIVRWACATLQALGAAAEPAIPALLGVDTTGRRRDLGPFADRALLSIAPGDPRVAADAKARLEAASAAPRLMPGDQALMNAVAHFAGEQDWARAILRPIVRDPALAERWGLAIGDRPGIAQLVGEDPSGHIRAADHAPVQAAVLDDPSLLDSMDQRIALEREARVRTIAVGALGTLARPSDEAIDAVSRSMALLPPQAWPLAVRERHEREGDGAAAMQEIRRLSGPLYHAGFGALTAMLERRPDRLDAVIDAFKDNPRALAYLFDGLVRREDEAGKHWFEVLAPLGEARASLVLDALLAQAEEHVERGWNASVECDAIARLSTRDPRRLQALLAWSRFGSDAELAASATRALGELRPVPAAAIDELRSVLTGPPDVRWQAALDACGAMGPLATPLLDELLAFAEPPNPPGFREAAAVALLEVAPDDPRVRAAAERWPELQESDEAP